MTSWSTGAIYVARDKDRTILGLIFFLQKAVVAAVLCGSYGYYLGTRFALSSLPLPAVAEKTAEPSSSPDTNEEEDDDEEPQGALSSIKPAAFEECKLVLVVRTDLGMTKGKIAAQCSHATLACYKSLAKSNPGLVKHWERTGQAKIALKCDSEDELLMLQAVAQSLNICAHSIQDAGRTQIAPGSRTVLGIGPAPVKLINQVTGKLKLL